MKYTKRCIKICSVALLIIIIDTFAILYFGSGDYPDYVVINDESVNDGEYAEFLFQIKPSDEYYTDYNDFDAEDASCSFGSRICHKFSKDSEIAMYTDGGYMSFSTHIKDAYTMTERSGKKSYYYIGFKYKTAKIAFVDKDGNIKNVTNEVRLVQHTLWGTPPSEVELIYENGKLTSQFHCMKEGFALYMMLTVFVFPALGLSFIAVTVTAIIDYSRKK